MDHYTKEAFDKVRQQIVENIDRLEDFQAKGLPKPGSGDVHNVKNWRRFGAAFAWDPEIYVDIMSNAGSMSDVDLMKELRKLETNYMKKWQAIDGMPMHHKIALRTGGDLGLRTPIDVWIETRERLYQRFGFKGGNGPSNLDATSQFNEGSHRNRQNSKGTPLGETVIPDEVLQETKPISLHRAGQQLGEKPSQYTPLINASSKEQAEYLEQFILVQADRFKEASEYHRERWQRTLFDDGINEFVSDSNGNRINSFSKQTILEHQPTIKTLGNAIQVPDGQGGFRSLAESAGAAAYGAPTIPQLDLSNAHIDTNTRIGRKAALEVSKNGALHWAKRVGPAALVPGVGMALSVNDARGAYAAGNNVEAAGHLIAGAVGEVPVVGDALVMAANGEAVADTTVDGFEKRQTEMQQEINQYPSRYRKSGPNIPTENANPSINNGYKTVIRGVNGILKTFGSNQSFATGLLGADPSTPLINNKNNTKQDETKQPVGAAGMMSGGY